MYGHMEVNWNILLFFTLLWKPLMFHVIPYTSVFHLHIHLFSISDYYNSELFGGGVYPCCHWARGRVQVASPSQWHTETFHLQSI